MCSRLDGFSQWLVNENGCGLRSKNFVVKFSNHYVNNIAKFRQIKRPEAYTEDLGRHFKFSMSLFSAISTCAFARVSVCLKTIGPFLGSGDLDWIVVASLTYRCAI